VIKWPQGEHLWRGIERLDCSVLSTSYRFLVSNGISDTQRFEAAIKRFDELNAADPNHETVNGVAEPRELLNARRLDDWVMKLAPDASEALRLAARCQHLCRWQIPRASYPMDRGGYLKWRGALKQFHAEKSGEVLRAVGYPEEMVRRVQDLNLKKNFPADPDSRALEDALCLVFLEHQLVELASKTAEDKVVNALRKSWQKMTPAAREHALKLQFGEREKALLKLALEK
jgi:hypothetical protein